MRSLQSRLLKGEGEGPAISPPEPPALHAEAAQQAQPPPEPQHGSLRRQQQVAQPASGGGGHGVPAAPGAGGGGAEVGSVSPVAPAAASSCSMQMSEGGALQSVSPLPQHQGWGAQQEGQHEERRRSGSAADDTGCSGMAISPSPPP